jgi:hypothetical protein
MSLKNPGVLRYMTVGSHDAQVGDRGGVECRGKVSLLSAGIDVVLDCPPAPQDRDLKEMLPRPRLGLVGRWYYGGPLLAGISTVIGERVALRLKVFRLNANRQSEAVDPEGDTVEKILDAAENCPVSAITVEDAETGERLFPRPGHGHRLFTVPCAWAYYTQPRESWESR